MPTTTNMGMVLPTVGASDDAWGTLVNDALTNRVDPHDHSTGLGKPVPIAGLRANADWPFTYAAAYYAITSLKAIDFQPQAPASVASYSSALFANSSDSNNLYYRNSGGANVRITNGGSLDLSSTGGIVGDYAAVGAAVTYNDADDVYTFREAAGLGTAWSTIGCESLDLHEGGAFTGTNRVRLSSPAALAANYALTFPAALPGAKAIVQASAAGALTFENTGVEAITMASNANVTLSGTGDLKHGDRVLVVSAYQGVVSNSANTPIYGVTPASVSYIGGNAFHFALPLTTGDRIKSVSISRIGDGAADITSMQVFTTSAAGVDTSIGSTSEANPSAAWGTLTLDVTDTTLASGESVSLVVVTNATALLLGNVRVTYDRP